MLPCMKFPIPGTENCISLSQLRHILIFAWIDWASSGSISDTNCKYNLADEVPVVFTNAMLLKLFQ